MHAIKICWFFHEGAPKGLILIHVNSKLCHFSWGLWRHKRIPGQSYWSHVCYILGICLMCHRWLWVLPQQTVNASHSEVVILFLMSLILCLLVSLAAMSIIAFMSVSPLSICFWSSLVIWIWANSFGPTVTPTSWRLLWIYWSFSVTFGLTWHSCLPWW